MKKKFSFIIGAVILVYLGCEIGSYLIYAAATRTLPSIPALISSKYENPFIPISLNQKITFFEDVAVHPYTGYNFLNEKTCLGLDFVPKRKPNQVIIAVTGGSVAALFYHFEKDALVKKLKETPFFQDKEIIMVSMSIAGLKQPQQLFFLTYALAQEAEFDILINIDGFNEMALPAAENIPHNVSPVFPRLWDLLAKSQTYDRAALQLTGKIVIYQELKRRWNVLFEDSPLRFIMTAHLIKHIGDKIFENLLNQGRLDFEQYKKPENRPRGPSFSFSNNSDLYQTLAKNWKRHSKMLRDLCNTNGITYFHFLQPNQYLEGSKPLCPEELETAFEEGTPYQEPIAQGYPLLREAGKELKKDGELFFDLSMIFAQETDPVYTDICCHYNALGNTLMLNSIAQAIITTLSHSEESFQSEKAASTTTGR